MQSPHVNIIYLLKHVQHWYIKNEHMYSFYKQASVTAYVSFCGPTNIPPVEAMYSGCPLICSNKYGMKNQIKNGGLLIDPSSYMDIYEKLMIIHSNSKLKNKIVKNGHKVIKKLQKNFFLKKLIKFL